MHTWYLSLGLFLLFGIDGSSSIDKYSRKDGTVYTPGTRHTKFFTSNNDSLLSSKQLDELEDVVNAIYERFYGPPPSKLSLRSNQEGKSGLSRSITIIGDTLRNHMKDLLKKFDVFSPNNERHRASKSVESDSLKFTVFYQLMKMPLEIKPIIQQIQRETQKYLNKNKYLKSGYKQTDFSYASHSHDSKNEWQNLAISETMKTYSTHIYKCLDGKKGSFDIKKALGKLMNSSPEAVGHIFRRRLDKPLPQHPSIRKSEYTKTQASICHTIVDDQRINYRKCLVSMKLVDKCVNAKLNDSSSMDSDSFAEKISESLVETVKSLDPTCNNFRGKMGFSVKCKESGRILKSNEFAYVTEFLLGDLKKSSVINRMANEFVSTVQKTHIGADATREIATLISIHQNAEEKIVKFLKTSKKDNQDEIFKNLADYQQNLASMGLRTMKNFNKAISNVEQVLVDSNLKVARQDLSPNVKVLKCFGDIIESIFNGFWWYKQDRNYRNGTVEATSLEKSSASSASIGVRNEIGFLKHSHDEPFKEWMKSMKQLSQSPSPRRSSALVSLARTFLLATMFYECMIILAAAIRREDSGPVFQNYDAENYVNDDWDMDVKKASETTINSE